MEPDQHSGPETGTGDRAPDPGAGLSHEVPDTHEAAPAEGALTEPAGPESDPSLRTDAIMSKLPRTRPQRITGRRHREPARRQASPEGDERTSTDGGAIASAGSSPAARRRAAGQRTAAPGAKKQPQRAARGAGGTPAARRRPGTAAPPSLPRLAMDGAVEAAKLPLKVGGRLTLRALDAVARGLRGS